MLFGDAGQWFVPTAVHLVVVLLGLSVWAWRGPRDSGRRRWRWAWSVLTAWAWLMSVPALANLLIASIEGAPVDFPQGPPPRAIAVLASGDLTVRHGRVVARLDEHGAARVSRAVQAWRQYGGVLIMAGGPAGVSSTSGESWAAAMRDRAVAEGVPATAIRLADQSANTYEDLRGVARVLRDAPGGGPVWLVTSALHMPRARAVAEHLGVDVVAVPADYQQLEGLTWRAWWPNAGGPASFASALHELIGLWVYRWRGWA